MSYEYVKEHATEGKFWNLPEINITGFVIHSIGCPQEQAEVVVDNFNRPDARASVHGFIEPNKFIETAPCQDRKKKAKKCYHVGSGPKGSYNDSRIGIEMTEPNTIKYTGGASFVDKNPEHTKTFVAEVTLTAVEVFADLCIFHGLSPITINSHIGSHKAGYGSNHGDPEHLWKHIGYSLAQFQKDVQKIIDEKRGDVLTNMTKEEFTLILDAKFEEFGKEVDEKITEAVKANVTPTYHTLKDVPAWGKPSVEKAMKNGFLSGTHKDTDGNVVLDLSYDFLRSIMLFDNTGAFDEAKE